MKLRNCTFHEFYERIQRKKLVAFGCGEFFKNDLTGRYPELKDKISYFIDNGKAGETYSQGERQIPIYPVSCLAREKTKDITVIICVQSMELSMEMYDELNTYHLSDNIDCYCAILMMHEIVHYPKTAQYLRLSGETPKINKVIHYFWFSGEEKPNLQKQCLESWKKFCPDYKIIEWNTKNYDVKKNKFMRQAIDKKKWAFASDFARLDVVYRYGGIYLDLDVELVRELDEVLQNEAFFSLDCGSYVDLGSGFGAVSGHPLIKRLLDWYENAEFIGQDGKMSDTPQPVVLEPIFAKSGLKRDGTMQKLENAIFYPAEYFSPIDYILYRTIITPNTIGIHHFDDAWHSNVQSEEKRKKMRMAKRIKELLAEC